MKTSSLNPTFLNSYHHRQGLGVNWITKYSNSSREVSYIIIWKWTSTKKKKKKLVRIKYQMWIKNDIDMKKKKKNNTFKSIEY